MVTTDTESGDGRDHVVALARASTGGLVDTRRAAEAWGVSRSTATSRLFRLVRAGWLAAIRRGLFYVLPLEAGKLTTVDDPWVLASQAFAPCYIGGWTAAEHWGLTEQIFRSTFVVTAGAARTTSMTLIGSEFRLVRASKDRVESVLPTWRGSVRVAVSDRERTLADGLANPVWVGGVRHLVEMLSTYKRSEQWSPTKLLSALAAHPKGAAYKRLGYLVENALGGEDALVKAALEHKSTGVIRLDPQVKATGKIITRWGLRLNVTLPAQDAS